MNYGLEVKNWFKDVIPDPNHLALVRWFIRNAGSKGFGPFESLPSRKIMEIREVKPGQRVWQFIQGFSEADIEQ